MTAVSTFHPFPLPARLSLLLLAVHASAPASQESLPQGERQSPARSPLARFDRNAMPQDDIPAPVRASARRGMQWLLGAQNRDGSWGDNAGSRGDLSNTCIATLALAAAGNTLTRGMYSTQMRRGVDYVVRRLRGFGGEGAALDSATLIQGKLGPNIDVYLSTVLFSQVLGMLITKAEQDDVQALLRRMTATIASYQQPNGAFETSYEPMLTTVMAFLALRQTHDAGITVHGASAQKVLDYLQRECLDQGSGVFREAKWGNQMRFVSQSGALRVLYGMDKGRTAIGRRATDVVLRMRFDQDVGGRSGGEEFLGAVLATQALFLDEDARFWRWYGKICKSLLACQNRNGSWFGHHCITGRVFCTSCSIITMLTPDKMLPMQFK